MALLALMLLAAVDVDADIVALLPEAPLPAVEPVPAEASAKQHADGLRSHPQHGKSFWVRGVGGDPSARRIVFLIPQYHRNITMPIAWTTLGREIADVQLNIDRLVRVLVTAHGLTCIGTEGTSRRNVSYSSELRQLTWWRRELERGRDATLSDLGGDAKRAEAAIDTTRRILDRAIDQHAVYLDGVGAAQSRLAGTARLVRFGTEEDGAHGEAIALLEELKRIEEELTKVDPGSEPEEAGVVGRMWLDEYPAYEKETLEALAGALVKLEALRRELRDGSTGAARALGAWMARVRRIADALIQPDEVASTIAYYREVARLAAAKGEGTKRELTPAQKETRAKLLARQSEIHGRYQEITRKHRERVAATRVIDRMNGTSHSLCALVMGAGHEDGLTGELEAAAKRAGLGPIGIVTVAPYDFE